MQLNIKTIDNILLISFCIFAITSWVFEMYIVFNKDFKKCRSWDIPCRLWYFYAASFDPIFLKTPMWLRIMCGIDGFIFGAMYLVHIYAFVHKKNWIRLPAIVFASMLLYSTIVYFLYEFIMERGNSNMFWMTVINIPYTIVPILLMYRMWDTEEPFGSNFSDSMKKKKNESEQKLQDGLKKVRHFSKKLYSDLKTK